VLKEVSLVAAEDTRRIRKLLQAYGIKTPVMSLYDHVESKKAPLLISRLRGGKMWPMSVMPERPSFRTRDTSSSGGD